MIAPKGFKAELKSSVNKELTGNICNSCDWREKCQSPLTDFTLEANKCMSYARLDGLAVIFKKA